MAKKKVSKKSVKSIKGRNGGTLNPGYNGQPVPGRPPGTVNWKTLYNQLLSLAAPETLLAEIKKVNPDAKLIQDIVTINTFNRALKGNPKAMELLHYYAGDKPTETVESNSNVTITNLDLTIKQKKEFIKKYLSEQK